MGAGIVGTWRDGVSRLYLEGWPVGGKGAAHLLKYQSISSPDTTWSPRTRDCVAPVFGRRSVTCADGGTTAGGSDEGVGACGMAELNGRDGA